MDTEKLVKAAKQAQEKITKLGFNDQLASELEWCLGSFKNDNNSRGLVEKVKISIKELTAYREGNPRKVSKKLLEDLSKAVT